MIQQIDEGMVLLLAFPLCIRTLTQRLWRWNP
jgi:hypothetical protein